MTLLETFNSSGRSSDDQPVATLSVSFNYLTINSASTLDLKEGFHKENS